VWTAGRCMTNGASADSDQAAPAVHTSDVACIVAGDLARPTPTPTPTPTPAPLPGTVLAIRKGGPGNSEDTFVYRYQPFTNYWLEPLLKVGYKQTNASLIKFDLSPIPPGAVIDEAWLEVYAVGWSGPGADITIGAYAVSGTVAISETTWVSPELGATWFLPGANDVVMDRREVPESTLTTNGILQWYRFDLTALVQEWLDGGTANNGALLRCESCPARRAGLISPPSEPQSDAGEQEGNASDRELQLPVGPLEPLPGQFCPYSFFFASGEYSDMSRWPRLVVRYQ
jgi:hypothetical protein